jgi:hypothetical protein
LKQRRPNKNKNHKTVKYNVTWSWFEHVNAWKEHWRGRYQGTWKYRLINEIRRVDIQVNATDILLTLSEFELIVDHSIQIQGSQYLRRNLIQKMHFGLDLVVYINIVHKCQQIRYNLSPFKQNLQKKANTALKLYIFSFTKSIKL